MKIRIVPLIGLTLSISCVGHELIESTPSALRSPESNVPSSGEELVEAPKEKRIQPAVAPEIAPPESPRLSDLASAAELLQRTRSYFEGHKTARVYLQSDKPIYQPGETIWLKSWDLATRDLSGLSPESAINYQLISPKGAVLINKRVQEHSGTANNDFLIPDGSQGGEYLIRATSSSGATGERTVVVSNYETPRIKKKLEFVKKAYGEADEVTATIEVKRPTGEPLANQELRGVVWLDGETLTPVKLTTNSEGGGLVRFQLPSRIEHGDGLLTVMVEDGGITESISKRVPIVLKRVQLSFFPEGGALVAGLPSRIYFEGKNTLGKPADLEGRIIDDHDNPVATFRTHHAGLGRFDFTPTTGRSYRAEVTRPTGIAEQFPLPLSAEQGCTLHVFDDLDGVERALRVLVRCSEPKKVLLVASLRENVLDSAAVLAGSGGAVLHLNPSDEGLARAQGIARVTLFDEHQDPLAERLVFRNRRNRMEVKIQPDQEAYAPREQVALTIRTLDPSGQPVPAQLAVSVVDDTVVSYADDKSGHLLSRLMLESELADKVEEPNFFFDLSEPKSALAMDLLMGTRGFRKFDWRLVRMPAPRTTEATTALIEQARVNDPPKPEEPPPPPVLEPAPQAKLRAGANPRPAHVPGPRGEAKPVMAPAVAPVALKPPPADNKEAEKRPDDHGFAIAGKVAKLDRIKALGDDDGERWLDGNEQQVQLEWAAVRVFPAPSYASSDLVGPRSDFRETIHWAPEVRTGRDGKAIITFYLSDAVSSFRVFAEGVGAGRAGREEKVIKSSLPFSLNIKLPTELSASDKILLPLSFSNERDRPLSLSLTASFGELLQLDHPIAAEGLTLKAHSRDSVFFPLTVSSKPGASKVRIAASAGGLSDEILREVKVVPLGFPQLFSQSGTLKAQAQVSLDLGSALSDSVDATIKLYPSPVSTLLSGVESMLQEPSGCFEQTSSSNYPNVMIMQYLRSHEIADPSLVERVNGMLDRGYKKLAGYETKDKGYEWFGSTPPHEALSAYGLFEFADMKKIYGGVDETMIQRTIAWLKSRRDGKGGYLRDPKALDSFGSASAEVTNAYITWSLSEAGISDLDTELAASAKLAATTHDGYLMALATESLLDVPALRGSGASAAKRLSEMQAADGSWPKADHSITRSTGINLTIETTALALHALMKAGGFDDQVRRGVEWLTTHRGGFGSWGATQATVLALRTMTDYANRARQIHSSGVVTLLINGQKAGEQAFESGRRTPIELTHLGRWFGPGLNKIELLSTSAEPLPYSVAVEDRSLKPANGPSVLVDLSTHIERSALKMGESVRLVAKITNKTDHGLPMTMARIGIPAGLSYQPWQLKELKEKGLVAFTETRPREVIVYLREMKPSESKDLALDLLATIPGETVGPASSAYLYYSDDQKVWADGIAVKVTP